MGSSNIARRANGKWRARYRDSRGQEHARHFDRKVDAKKWLDEITSQVVTGTYVDPNAGKITFKEYAEQWRVVQMHRQSTAVRTESILRNHAYPAFGHLEISEIRPGDIQAWVKKLLSGKRPLSASTVANLHGVVSGIFKDAVRDKRLRENPCAGTRLPRVRRAHLIPLETKQVWAIHGAVPERYQAMITLSAGSGMRQGEVFGLTADRVDFLRKTVRVDRQLVYLAGKEPFLGDPKTHASVRTIPLPDFVIEALARHIKEFGAGPTGLLFVDEKGEPLRRNRFSVHVWRPAVKAAGAPRDTGFHDLRHYYASLLIRHGCSIKVVQARLGHATAAETLDTYAHLWPDSDDQTREAISTHFLKPVADCLRTAETS